MTDIRPGFADAVQQGHYCGWEEFRLRQFREHAPWPSRNGDPRGGPQLARIFYRNAINIGLPILEWEDLTGIMVPERIRVDLERGDPAVEQRPALLRGSPEFMQEIIRSRDDRIPPALGEPRPR